MNTLSLRMPDYLKNAVNDVCANEKISINQFIVNALSKVPSEVDALPYRYLITKRDKLQKNSDACIYEIRALSKTRVKEKLSILDDEELVIIQDALCQIVK